MTDIPEARRPSPARGAWAALAGILAYWLAEATAQTLYYWPVGSISVFGWQWALAHSALVVLGLLVGALLIGRIAAFGRMVALTFFLGCLISAASWLWIARMGELESQSSYYRFVAVSLIPQALALAWFCRGQGRRALIGLIPAACFVGAQILSETQLISDPLVYQATTEGESDYDTLSVDIEALYGAQDGLMQEQIAALAPERPGLPDVFALLVAGTSYQSVFLSEIDQVAPILDAQYGAGQRTLRLANSEPYPLRYPLANKTNLDRALAAIGTRMGPEDLAFIFLTSHGAEDRFALSFYEAGTTDLSASDFAGMLGRSGIGPAIVVISACHSGSFIDDIAEPNRLIIAASRGDRTSFGCANGNDWTEFGRFFFDHALRAEPDPRKAFGTAMPLIRAKEFWDLRKASLPQISEGASIGPVIDSVLAPRQN